MMHEAAFILMRLFKLIACVMAYHRSTVMMVNVNTDKWFANTVKNPATRQPAPAIFILLLLFVSNENRLNSFNEWYECSVTSFFWPLWDGSTILHTLTESRMVPNWIYRKRLIKLKKTVLRCWTIAYSICVIKLLPTPENTKQFTYYFIIFFFFFVLQWTGGQLSISFHPIALTNYFQEIACRVFYCTTNDLTVLPIECMVKVFAHCVYIDGGNQHQIKSQTKVGKSQMAHQEFWNCHFIPIREHHQQHCNVAKYSQKYDHPNGCTQPLWAHHVFTRIQCIWNGIAFDINFSADVQQITLKMWIYCAHIDTAANRRPLTWRWECHRWHASNYLVTHQPLSPWIPRNLCY